MTRETKGKRLIMPDDILATKGSVGRLKKRVQKLESNPVSSGSGAVDSVFTRTGDVVAVANDYAHAQVSGLFGYYQSSTADIPQSRITGLFGYYQPSATFAENVSDQVGTMVTGNTETNITVTYQDADNTLDFSVPAATTTTAGVIEIATAAEVATGTDTSRAIVPADVDQMVLVQTQTTGLSGYYLSSVNPLKSLMEASDHGTATTDMIGNWCYGTSSTPPTASTTTEGALYFMYSA